MKDRRSPADGDDGSMIWDKAMDLSDLIKPDAILGSLKANSKKQVIQALAEKAAEMTGIEERQIFETLLQREKLGSAMDAMRELMQPHR